MTGYASYLVKGRGLTIKALLALMTTALATLTLTIAFALPAKADLAAVGPVDTDPADAGNGQDFPFWFQDQKGLRLGLCFGGGTAAAPLCLAAPGDLTPPDGEAFWFQSTATLNTSGGEGAIEMATEAAYLDGAAAFNRVRMRIDVAQPGDYTVTYPYGEKTFTVAPGQTGGRAINFTDDIGCAAPPCGDFATSTRGPIDQYLTWDTFGTGTDEPPAGYIGDPNVEHAVTGSTIADTSDPSGFRNYVEIRGPGIAPDGGNVVRTRLFSVQGKIHGVAAFANPKGGTYKAPQNVTLKSSDPGAEIRYTTDGSEPTATNGTVYSGPIAVDGGATGTTTLKFKAFAGTSESP